MHEESCFITLTYNNENIPQDKSIHKKEIQKFIRSLRKKIKTKIRYFACGEYGDESGRPHYHAIIFGYDFSKDRQIWMKTKTGNIIYRSELLEKTWTKGYSSIGDVTFESAAYVARYVMKKRKGNTEKAEKYSERYNAVDSETGDLYNVEEEFCLMSRRPGIGKTWYEKYKGDTDKDFITIRGKPMKLPKFYDHQMIKEDEEEFNERSYKRWKEAVKHKKDNTWQRLEQRETVKKAQTQQLKRGL